MESTEEENCWLLFAQNDSSVLEENHPCNQFFDEFSILPVEYEDTLLPHDQTSTTVLHIWYGIFFVFGLIGNIWIIYFALWGTKTRSSSNMYFANFAAAHIVFLMGMPFLILTALRGSWVFGRLWCKAYFVTTTVNDITCSFFLAVMCINIYRLIGKRNKSTIWRFLAYAKVVSVVIWILSLLLAEPIAVYSNTLEIENLDTCNIFWPESELFTGEQIYVLYISGLGFCLPFALIIPFSILIVIRLTKVDSHKSLEVMAESQELHELSGTKNSRNVQEKNECDVNRDAKLVLAISIAHFVCALPYWIIQMSLAFESYESSSSNISLTLFLLFGCLKYGNTILNPIIYAIFCRNQTTRNVRDAY